MAFYLVDTNVLVYLVNPQANQHTATIKAISALLQQGHTERWSSECRRVLERGHAPGTQGTIVDAAAGLSVLFAVHQQSPLSSPSRAAKPPRNMVPPVP